MDVIRLQKFNELAAKYIEQFGTWEDFKILLDVAAGENHGSCQTLKQLLLSSSIPESTLKRRLAKLVRQRFVLKRMTTEDRRVHCYSLHEETRKVLDEMIRDIRSFCWE